MDKLQYILGIRTDGTQTAKEFDRVADSVRKVDSAAGGAASAFEGFGRKVLAIIGPLTVFRELTGTFSMFGGIADQAKRAGVSAEKFQAWSQALGESGVDPSAIFAANRTLARQQTDVIAATAAGKTTDATQAFGRLGIPLDVVAKLDREKLLELVAEQAAKGPTKGPAASQFAGDLQTLLGRDADALLAAFRDGFSDKVRSAYSRGLVASERDVATLDEYGDRLAGIRMRSRVWEAQVIGDALDPYHSLRVGQNLGLLGPSVVNAKVIADALRIANQDIVQKLDEKL